MIVGLIDDRFRFLFFVIVMLGLLTSCQADTTAVVSNDQGDEIIVLETLPPLSATIEASSTPTIAVISEVTMAPRATSESPAVATIILPTKDAAGLLSGLQASNEVESPAILETTLTPVVLPSPTSVVPATLSANQIVGTDEPVIVHTGIGFAAAVAADPSQSFVKIGFHIGPEGEMSGLREWMETLDAAGIPFFLKSVGMAGPLLDAQNLRAASGVPHVLVYRRSGDEFELPNYNNDPLTAAQEHWELHRDAFPPELDPAVVWLETINEVDKQRSSWLGAFALATAQLAVRDGFRWAAFGWSAGEPEIRHWAEPNMVQFLQYAAAHPEQVAVALHEYSFEKGDLFRDYPHLVGRFQQLYWVCDQLGIERPTVLITEFGWEYRNVAGPAEAVPQLVDAAALYAGFPQVKGAAIWYLGGGFGDIDTQAVRLLPLVTDFAAQTYFSHPPLKGIDAQIFR